MRFSVDIIMPCMCGAATIQGVASTCTHVHSLNNKPACIYINARTCTRTCSIIAVDPLPCCEISRVVFIGMVGRNHDAASFESYSGGISRCGKISRKYGVSFPDIFHTFLHFLLTMQCATDINFCLHKMI